MMLEQVFYTCTTQIPGDTYMYTCCANMLNALSHGKNNYFKRCSLPKETKNGITIEGHLGG